MKVIKMIASLTLLSSLACASSIAASSENYISFSSIVEKNISLHKKNTHVNHKPHWSYSGIEGPSYWGDLGDTYSDCKTGKRQSPIDIETTSEKLGISDAGIYFNYNNVDLDIVNNGHTIQVNISGDNESVINGKKYKLLQFHFHAPSEHTIDGKPIAMEAHLVHIAADGELAVIGVLMKEGAFNPFIEKIFNNMPTDAGKHKKNNNIKINTNDILPTSKAHWHYMGSLTTPPCTQIVEWYLLKEAITISPKQLKQFHALYNGNSRPVQGLNKRVILQK